VLVQAESLQLLLRPPTGEGLAASAGREACLMTDLDAMRIYNVGDLYLVVKTFLEWRGPDTGFVEIVMLFSIFRYACAMP
jgi:hypothetical protein